MSSNIELTKNSIIYDPEMEFDFHARSCEQCNSGMNTGCVLNESTTLCSKKCLQEYWSIDDNNIDSHVDEALADDNLYWTEWDEINAFDNYTWYSKDGTEGDTKSLIPLLFKKSFKGDENAFNIAFSLLKFVAEKDSNFPFALASTSNVNFSNILSALSSIPVKQKFIQDIINIKHSPNQGLEEFFIWTNDNIISSMGKYQSIDDALVEVQEVEYNWVANDDALSKLHAQATSIIEPLNPNTWYALSMDGEIYKLGTYDSMDDAQEDNGFGDDIVYYMNTDGLNDFIIQYPFHKPKEPEHAIGASLNTGFNLTETSKQFEVELRDETDLVKSEFYDTIHEANHRIGWVNKQNIFDWNDIEDYDFGPEQYISYTSDGIQDLGYFIKGNRVEFDNKGNKMSISTDDVANEKFGDDNWSFISSESEARQQKHDLTVITNEDKAHYVGLDGNGKMHPIHTEDYTGSINEFEKICKDNNTTYVEVVRFADSYSWLESLNALFPTPPQYQIPSQFGLDFNITELNPTLTSQWISQIKHRPQPKRIHSLSFSDSWDIVDEESGQTSKFDISFNDDFEVGINATTEDVYDKLLHFLEDTVINGDLTPFTFTPDNNSTGIYDIFLEYLQDTVNNQDLTAFNCQNIKIFDENPHFIVNDDFTLSCVQNDDVACDEHAHGWFDTNNNVSTLLPALNKLHKTNKHKINHLPF